MTDTEAEEQPAERLMKDPQGVVKAEVAGEATETLQGDEAGCSSGESNTRAKRSASATTTNYKDGSGSPSGSRRPGSGNGSGDGGSGHGSRAGSGNEDGPTSAKPRATTASGKAGAAGKGGKRKLARPEGTAQCPRCESNDTKFCYYNNYNIKQPRYFCKTCQRYWTAGGILRNVPVGAGRRKSKASAVREQEKAAAAVAAKQARQVAAHGCGSGGQAAGANGASGPGMPGGIDTGQQPQLMSAAGDLLPAGPMGGGGPAPGFGADQLRFMMDPCAQLAAGGMGGPGSMMGGPGGAMMGGPGGMGPMSFDAPTGYSGGFGPGAGMMLPPHAAGGMGGMRMGGDAGGMLPSGSGGTLGTESAVLSGPVGSGFSGGAADDGGRADGRRVRAKLDGGGGHSGSMGGGHGGGIPPSNSAGSLGKGLPGGSAGGDDRHPEWAAAAQAAERQQAAALAAQMAAQASMQQAAAMQAQAQLQGMAAAAQWGQPAAPFGMPGTGMWPSYPGMAAPSYGVGPNWAAAAQLNARFGNNGFGGNMSSSGDPSSGNGAVKSPTMAGGAHGDVSGGDLSGAPGMMGGGWNGMMPTGSAPMNFNPGWGMGGDMGGGWGGLPGVPHMSMPAGKHMGSMSGGGGPAGSSLASGQSANTGLQPPSAAV